MDCIIPTESLLVVKTVGLQITTIFASGRKSAKFISWERIQGVVINETITMHQVLFYLAILLKYGHGTTTEILPIFQHSLPRLDCLKKIYKSIHLIVNQYKVQHD
uniref:Phosphatidylinositol N-acetylglucosaminyltransferase subunit H conserved domain-containing protein n=1 Tax=Daphnia galeata TaxID=27404 RepID=A0A8J2RHM6_9CRUS|nr:unnamed protein product [Daphnia galeata]